MARHPLLFVLASAVVVVPASAHAQSQSQRVSITATDCRQLVRHVPSADVAYKPGVDVHGNAVAPADLPGSGGAMKVLPDVLEFTYTVNPTNWTGKGTPAAGLAGSNTQMGVAAVKYDFVTGTLFINGQPMGGADQQAIAEECRKQGIR